MTLVASDSWAPVDRRAEVDGLDRQRSRVIRLNERGPQPFEAGRDRNFGYTQTIFDPIKSRGRAWRHDFI
jgi:hypothetical protein